MKSLRITLLVFPFLLLGNFSLAQDSLSPKYIVNLNLNYGFIIAHDPTMVNLETGHIKSCGFTFCRHSNPDNRWGNDYQYPDCGFGVSYFNLANPELLGNAFSVYACSYFPVSRNKNFKWNIEMAYGLGYIEKPFRRVENYKNTAIGSHFNAFIQLTNTIVFHFDKRNKILLGISFSHFSNGSFKKPNLGINIPAIKLSYGRYFGSEKMNYEAKNKDYLPQKWQQFLYVAFGVKGIEINDLRQYQVYTIGYENVKYFSKKCGYGFGAEAIYDNSLNKLIELENGIEDGSDFQLGVYGEFMLRMGKLEADADVAFCPVSEYHDPETLGNDYIYSKFCLKRYFLDKFYLTFNLKTHFVVADHFEFGLGMKL